MIDTITLLFSDLTYFCICCIYKEYNIQIDTGSLRQHIFNLYSLNLSSWNKTWNFSFKNSLNVKVIKILLFMQPIVTYIFWSPHKMEVKIFRQIVQNKKRQNVHILYFTYNIIF